MNPLHLAFLLAGIFGVWLLLLPVIRFTSFQASIFVIMLCAFIATAWLLAIRDSQLAPHKIITHIGGQVLDEHWATNNETITYGWRQQVGTNGIELVSYPVTNELWHVWAIFK